MFTTKNIVTDIAEIPSEWIFSFYLELEKDLDGKSIYMKSPFSNTDTRPSMVLYNKEGKYKFKDFSSGYQGTAVDFLMYVKGVDYAEAVKTIVKDYNDNPDFIVKPISKETPWNIELINFEVRSWYTNDRDYWLRYKIGTKLLNLYNVKPLRTLRLMIRGELYEFYGDYMYGYFNKKGELCKVYRPMESRMRFIRIVDYLQGSDQVEDTYKLILIQSSLKDIMAMKSLGIEVNGIAPEGESTLIQKSIIDSYLENGFTLATLFDGDKAGIKGMLSYKKEYNIPMIVIPQTCEFDKDIAEIRKNYEKQRALEIIVPKINKLYD